MAQMMGVMRGQTLELPTPPTNPTPQPASTDPRLDTIEIWRREPRLEEQFKPKDERPIPKVEIKDDRQISKAFLTPPSALGGYFHPPSSLTPLTFLTPRGLPL